MMQDRFAQQRRFNSVLQRQGNCGRAASGWLTITAAAGMDAGARAGSPGWRGLWKRTRDDNGKSAASFAVPLAVFDEIDDGDGAE